MKSLIETLKALANQNSPGNNWRNSRRANNPPLTFETLQPRALLATIATVDGLWSDPSIWSSGAPDATQQAIISPNVTVELDEATSFAKELVIQGDLVVTEDASVPNKTLTTDWVHVNGVGAEFIVGSAEDRYDEGTFTLNLVGINKHEDTIVPTVMGDRTLAQNDGFLMTAMMGRVQFYGAEKLSFTKLAATAGPDVNDGNTITVANVIERNFNANGEITTSPADDGELNWELNDQIVIASSSYDYTEEEVRIITGIVNNGETTTLTLDRPLEHRHYGETEAYENYEIDLRAEVALLNRNIKIQGLETQDTDVAFGDRDLAIEESRTRPTGLSDAEWESLPENHIANGVGGHLMFMGTSGDNIVVDGVQLDRLGQTGTKGRYPIHWHLGQDRDGDVFRNSSVTNSNNRGVTIHGTENLNIEGVVLHDIHGHGFFFEDAAETGNTLVGNLVIGVHAVGGNDQDFANPGGTDPFVVDTHDSVLETGSRFSSSAAFWITNPDNNFIGNISAGAGDTRGLEFVDPGPAGTGFWYAIPRKAIGQSADRIERFAGITPIYAEFGQFDFNTSHTTAVGLNFDRGSDIEDARFEGTSGFDSIQTPNEYSPRVGGVEDGAKTTNFVNGFTNYKASDAAVYHRGEAESIQFNNLRIADSANGPWAVSENIYNNSLFVGNSRGNADTSVPVGGPRLYDGAGLYTGTHFAGFAGDNADTFQVEGSSFGPTIYHAFAATSFEDDGTFENISFAVSDFDQDPADGHDLSRPFKWIKGAIDLDGTLTGANGGAGFSILPNIDFLVDADDQVPHNWDAVLTDDIYARIRVENFDDGSDKELFPSDSNGEPVIFFTARDDVDGDKTVGVVNGQNNGDHSWASIVAKTDGDGEVEGTFTVEFGRLGIPEGGFVLNMKNQDGGRPQENAAIQQRVEGARIVTKIVGAGNYTPVQGTEVTSESDLRTETEEVVYFRDGLGNLYLNTGIEDGQDLIQIMPGDPLQTSFDAEPPTVTYGSTVQAERFDSGIRNIAWFDTDDTNSLGSYRNDTGVDATETKVGTIFDGEWLEYTVNIVPSAYDIGLNVSATAAGGQIRVLAAASNSAGFLTDFGVIDVPDTGGEFETVWLTESANLFPISNPESVIRLEFIGGGFEVDFIEFAAPEQLAYREHAITADLTTSKIELEAFDRGGQGVSYFDDTPGNDNNKPGNEDNFFRDDEDVDADAGALTGKVFEGEWLEYTVDIQPGDYDITLKKNWGGADNGVKLFVADSNDALGDDLVFLGEFDFATDDNNEEITLSDIDLTPWAGSDRVIRIEIVGNYMGLDHLEFTSKTQVAPTIESVVVNDGSTQRSVVRELTVTFDEEVNADASSFLLMNTTTNKQIIPMVTTELIDGRTVATLTFNGSGIVGGSLADGDYTLTTLASALTDTAGNQLDGDGDGTGGDNATDSFFRFFGDANADRTVNVFDLLQFRTAYRGSDADFDYGGDGTVNVFDLLEFRKRYRNTL